jgi:hypothetical protein
MKLSSGLEIALLNCQITRTAALLEVELKVFCCSFIFSFIQILVMATLKFPGAQ